MKLIQLIKILKKSLKKNLNVEIGALGYRKNESMKCLRKTYNYPSWKPRFKLIDDLRKIFDQV